MKELQLIFFLFLNIFSSQFYSQLNPRHSDTLHYLNIYFSDTAVNGAVRYELNLYTDSGYTRQAPIFADSARFPAFRASVPEWGRTYVWQMKAMSADNGVIYRSPLHRFTLAPRLSSLSFDEIRIEVKRNEEGRHAGGYLVIDYLKGIFDRTGKPLWILPHIPGISEASTQVRDLKFTDDNTLTFLTNNTPVEIDLKGNVLWRLREPFVYQRDTIIFHHDFRKTKQGTYLALGNRKLYRRILDFNQRKAAVKRDYREINGNMYIRIDIPIVFEFDKAGKILWYWDADHYLTDEDLNFRKTPDGFPIMYPHANAIGVNAENSKVLIGCRDISRIIKIDKATKKVETSYGEKYPSGEARLANGLFLQQHDAKVTDHNSILVFNNNGARRGGGYSSILELRDNVSNNDSILLWSFDLNFDTLSSGKSKAGGNVSELPNSNILLCGGQLNRIFEVTRSKQVVWDGFIYARGKQDTLWQPMPNYRCSWTPEIRINHLFTGNVKSSSNRNLIQIHLPLVNVNSFKDHFMIRVFDAKMNLVYEGKTEEVKPLMDLNHLIEFERRKTSKGAYTIEISSVTDSSLKKDLKISVK